MKFLLSNFFYQDAPAFIQDIVEDTKEIVGDFLEAGKQETPGKKTCSFCGIPIQYVTSVEGTGKLNIIKVQELEWVNGIEVMVERVKHTTKHVIACPSCSRKVNKVNHHIKG